MVVWNSFLSLAIVCCFVFWFAPWFFLKPIWIDNPYRPYDNVYGPYRLSIRMGLKIDVVSIKKFVVYLLFVWVLKNFDFLDM